MAILNTRTRIRVFSIALLVFLILAVPTRFIAQEQDEYAVKAAFILRLSKFVEWPATTGKNVFVICIVGDNPFENVIDQQAENKTVNGLPVQIRRLKDIADVKACHIAFVSSEERSRTAKLIDALRGSAVLSIGETQDFLRMGGMIALSTDEGRVNIVINTAATQNTNLKVSAKLLMMATIYKN